jgi:hypothetical protein
MVEHLTSRPLPFFVAYIQGGDYIINVKVDKRADRADHPDQEAGFAKDVWIKYKDYEWEIDLENLEVEFKNGSEQFFSHHECWDERGKKKWFPCKYKIDLPYLTINLSHHQRAITFDRKEGFDKHNPDLKDYYGAVISEERIRYLEDLKQVLI